MNKKTVQQSAIVEPIRRMGILHQYEWETEGNWREPIALLATMAISRLRAELKCNAGRIIHGYPG